MFFKGCPLRCTWCHNPESQDFEPALSYVAQICVACGACAAACPEGAHTIRESVHHFDRALCRLCLGCTTVCPTGALESVGYTVTVDEVIAAVEKDRVFYMASGGGMTLSGGEPTAQPAFALALLQAARASGIHTCVETCGFGPAERFAKLVPHVDLFLWDIKDTDAVRHREHTGVAPETIWDNLRLVDAAGGKTVLRCLLIEGINTTPEHLDAVVALYARLRHCQGIDLLAYHPFGLAKTEKLGLAKPDGYSAPGSERMAWAKVYLDTQLEALASSRQAKTSKVHSEGGLPCNASTL